MSLASVLLSVEHEKVRKTLASPVNSTTDPYGTLLLAGIYILLFTKGFSFLLLCPGAFGNARK